MDKRYDRIAFIQAYAATKEPQGHEDFARFNSARLAALEKAFGLKLTWEGVTRADNSDLWMLFSGAVRSYLSISTPSDGFLDSTGINILLEKLGDEAKPMLADLHTIVDLADASRKAHLGMLDELFVLLWGDIGTVVTSEQLRALGFDDAQEPNWLDYE
ncbi:MAG TPA: hypothetical protein VGE07_23465 [Herpetosiphonaceae bacterium]